MKVVYLLMTALTLSACVPYPHSVTRNPTIEGRVLSAESGQAVAGAKIEMKIHSDESWAYDTVSDAEGHFAFAEHNDYRLFALLADAPQCWTTLSISAPGYRTRQCGWIDWHWCSSAQLKLPRLMLQSEHVAVSTEDAEKGYWSCLESATETVN